MKLFLEDVETNTIKIMCFEFDTETFQNSLEDSDELLFNFMEQLEDKYDITFKCGASENSKDFKFGGYLITDLKITDFDNIYKELYDFIKNNVKPIEVQKVQKLDIYDYDNVDLFFELMDNANNDIDKNAIVLDFIDRDSKTFVYKLKNIFDDEKCRPLKHKYLPFFIKAMRTLTI